MKQKPLKINTPLIYSRNLLLAPISAWIPPNPLWYHSFIRIPCE